jgi:hypothetical protein
VSRVEVVASERCQQAVYDGSDWSVFNTSFSNK